MVTFLLTKIGWSSKYSLRFPCSKTPLQVIHLRHVTGLRARKRLKLSHLLHSSMERAFRGGSKLHIWRNAWKLGQTYPTPWWNKAWEPVPSMFQKSVLWEHVIHLSDVLQHCKSAWQDGSEQSQHTSFKYNTSPKFQAGPNEQHGLKSLWNPFEQLAFQKSHGTLIEMAWSKLKGNTFHQPPAFFQ